MGLFRIGGGTSGAGLQHYLETGQKLGRELTRDELDKRIVLEGDLGETAEIIDRMHTATPNAERFLHLTFSFKEDDISPEMYAAINADIKDFLLGAYEPGEMTYYAEAHDPKIESELDYAGKPQERRPHLHIIVPKWNNLTGRREDPLGMLSAKFGGAQTTESIIDAFQEHLNHKYGLASPKDEESRRVDFTSRSDILSRIDGHDFKGKNREWQQTIRDRMISEKIETPEAFKTMLETIGEVSIGNKGPDQYWQVKPHGEQKNVRLKNFQFTESFILKKTAVKEAFIHQERVKRYLETNPGRPTPDKIKEVLAHWEMRKLEIRFIHTGSKLFRETYKHATAAEKLTILKGLKEKFYAKAKREFGFAEDSQPTLEEAKAAALAAEFPNRRLNVSHMRTIPQIREAMTKGEEIIANPEKALEEMTFSQSTINDRDLERYLLKNSADQEQYDEAMAAILAAPGLVVRQDEDGNTTFTTEDVVRIEKSLIATVERMVNGQPPPTTSNKPSEPETDFEKIAREVASTKSMNDGQRKAYDTLVSDQQIGIVNGAAGTGKSYILAAMRETYELTGHTVYGAILQGKTAEDLERDSGIKSSTMHSFISRLDKGTLKLDSKSVVVVDEAGMIGSRQMESILRHVEKAGAKIRLVGDVKQLASVEYGRAFKEVSDRVQVASLTQIMRQKEDWQRVASEQLSRHEIAEPLKAYADNGNVIFSENAAAAQAAVVEKWAGYRAADPAQSLVVLVHTNAERKALNRLMRDEIKKSGGLQSDIDVSTAEGTLKMAVGESVMFTKGDRELGVKNGTSGTIESIKGDSITVKLDNGKIAVLSAKGQGDEPNSITYGYSSTVHKSQGMTKDRAIILANASMSLENTYVAMSRHKTSLDIVADQSVFNDLSNLIARLDKTGRKDFSHDASQKEWESARKNDSVLAQYQADFAHDKIIERAAKSAGFIEMRDNLDARLLLDRVAKTHRIDLGKYGIVKNANGLDRIQCGSRLLNVSDFMTKIMNLDWKTEAAPAMRETYAAQLEAIYAPQREPGKAIASPMAAHEVSKPLWRDFQAFRAERATEYKAATAALTKELATRKAALAHDAQVKKSHAQNSGQTFAAKRNEIKDIRAEAAEAVKVLNKEISDRRGELMDAYKKQPAAEYKDFLAAGAVVSDKHLDELRRVSLSKPDQERIMQIEKTRKAVVPTNPSARSAEDHAVAAAREVREALRAAELRAAEARRLAELSALRLKEQAVKAAADKAAAVKKEAEKIIVLAKSVEIAAAAEGQLKTKVADIAPKVVNKGPRQGVAAKVKQNKIPNHVKAQQKKGGLGL